MHTTKHTLESKQKMSEANKGKRYSPATEFQKGKHYSPTTEIKKGQSISPATQFEKGQIPWNVGKKHSPETRQAISEALKGKPSWNKGKKMSEESRQKMSESRKGRIPWNKGKSGLMPTPWNKDKTGVYSPETLKKISEASKSHTGELASNWQGGITPANTIARHTLEYAVWRDAVFHRDNYTCQVCDEYNGYLHADHIKPFANHPELRYDIANGRTLCRSCHYYITFKRKMPSTSKWGLKRRA